MRKILIICLVALATGTIYAALPTVTSMSTLGVTNATGTSLSVTGTLGVTNGSGTALLVGVTNSSITNLQTAFCVNATNLTVSVTNAGVVGSVAWVCTNTPFTATGGSGLLQSIIVRNSTNQDFIIWAFSRVVTAPTVGSAWTPSQVDLQYLAGKWDTTNSMWRPQQLAGTNYIIMLDRLSTPIKNTDGGTNLHLIATYLDTKSNYVNSATYIQTGFINDR